MELNWVWQVILIFFVGTFLLRIGGRKSISQMTISQTIVMIGLGSLLIQPIAGKGLLITFLASLLMILLMIFAEFLSVKIDMIENLFIGKAVIVIENGRPNMQNMKKLRLTVDKLETRLRQQGISSIEDIKYATLEVSGQIGFELKENNKPMTKAEYNTLMNEILQIKQLLGSNTLPQSNLQVQNDIFEEVKNNLFESNKKEPN